MFSQEAHIYLYPAPKVDYNFNPSVCAHGHPSGISGGD